MPTNLPTNVVSLINALEQVATRVAASDTPDHPFLKLAKHGEWCFGAEDQMVDDDTLWAINPHTLSTGFAAWGDGELLGEKMGVITDPPIVKAELPDVGADWKPQVGMQLACVSGPQKGQQVLYKSTSIGGQRAFKTLAQALLARAHAGETDVVPVVRLEVSDYRHAKYGKVFVPVFEIAKWAALDGQVPADDTDPDPEPAARRRRRRPAA